MRLWGIWPLGSVDSSGKSLVGRNFWPQLPVLLLFLRPKKRWSKFQESEEFEKILTDRAAPIYDDAVRRCRRVLRRTLREKGRIVEDDIRVLDPDVSEGEDEVVEVADG